MKVYVEDTLKDGTEVLGELQEDVEEEVFSKTSEHFDKISEKMGNTFNDLHGLMEKNDEICKDRSALIVLLIICFPRGGLRYLRGRSGGAGREAERDQGGYLRGRQDC